MSDEREGVYLLPVDFSKLKKGGSVSIAEIERYSRAKYGTVEYGWGALRLKKLIENYFEFERKEAVSIKQKSGVLLILDDESSVEYNARAFSKAMSRAKEAQRRALGTDASRLSDEAKQKLERILLIQGSILSAADNAKKQVLRTLAHKRDVPRLE
jgi:hypothetical protein